MDVLSKYPGALLFEFLSLLSQSQYIEKTHWKHVIPVKGDMKYDT